MQQTKFMALVALADNRFPQNDVVLSNLNARLPEGVAKILETPEDENDDGTMMIEIGDAAYVCICIDGPAPAGTFETAARASNFWRDAATDLERHTSHIVVAEFSAGESSTARQAAAAHVSLLTAAVCTSVDAIGIHWTTGDTVTRPEPFLDAIGQIGTGSWPVFVWLQYYWIAAAENELPGLATYGLAPFLGRELEFEPGGLEQQTLFTRAGQIASYLLDHGDVLKDGETLGISESERIRIRHLGQGRQPGIPVFHFTLERSGALH